MIEIFALSFKKLPKMEISDIASSSNQSWPDWLEYLQIFYNICKIAYLSFNQSPPGQWDLAHNLQSELSSSAAAIWGHESPNHRNQPASPIQHMAGRLGLPFSALPGEQGLGWREQMRPLPQGRWGDASPASKSQEHLESSKAWWQHCLHGAS